MSEKREQRKHSREFKITAVRRMLAGESSSALARKLGVSRKLLNDWRGRVLQGGEETFARRVGLLGDSARRDRPRRMRRRTRRRGWGETIVSIHV